MKKTIIILALVAFGATVKASNGDTLSASYKKIIVGKDTMLRAEYVIQYIDTLKYVSINDQILKYQNSYNSGNQSMAIQAKLNEYYLAEIKRLMALKKEK